MLMVFQNRCCTLTPGVLNLLIKLKVLAAIFRIRFVVLPSVPMLPHLKCHLPQLPNKARRPSFGCFAGSLRAKVCSLHRKPGLCHTAFQETAPSNYMLVVIRSS
jgi:hypothetical protein